MPEAYGAPYDADQPSNWQVATACDIRLGETIRGYEGTRDSFIDINADTVQQALNILSDKGKGSILFTAMTRDSTQPRVTINDHAGEHDITIRVEVGEEYKKREYVPDEMREELAVRAYDSDLLERPELFAYPDQGPLRQKARQRIDQDLNETRYRVYKRTVLQEQSLKCLVHVSDSIARSQSKPRSIEQEVRRHKLETWGYVVAPTAVATLTAGTAAFELSGMAEFPTWIRLIGTVFVAATAGGKTYDRAINLYTSILHRGNEARQRRQYAAFQAAKQHTADIISFKPLGTQETTEV